MVVVFPGPVRTEKAEDFAGVDIERDIIHRFLLTIRFCEISR